MFDAIGDQFLRASQHGLRQFGVFNGVFFININILRTSIYGLSKMHSVLAVQKITSHITQHGKYETKLRFAFALALFRPACVLGGEQKLSSWCQKTLHIPWYISKQTTYIKTLIVLLTMEQRLSLSVERTREKLHAGLATKNEN